MSSSAECSYTWGENEGVIGPMGIDYVYFCNCTMSHFYLEFLFLAFIWVCMLMNLLASTAEVYFSPTLGKICDNMSLSMDIAGVTFLALGNGAPDFFSIVASFSGGSTPGGNVDVGVGALLGASVFVVTVVVGAIAILCPCEVSKKVFIRDVSFHLLATTFVALVGIVGEVNVLFSLTFIVIYVSYVLFVIFGSKFSSREDISALAGDIGMQTIDSGAVQTAFWHNFDSLTQHQTKKKKPPKPPPYGSNHGLLSGNRSGSGAGTYRAPTAGPSSAGGYSFLILSDDIKGTDGDADSAADAMEGLQSGTINLSGGFAPDFESIIQEDFYAAPSSGSLGTRVIDNSRDTTDGSLEASLLGDDHVVSSSGSRTFDSAERGMSISDQQKNTGSRSGVNYQDVITALYWQQWALKRQFKHGGLFADWDSYSKLQKILFVCELPFRIARDISIPSIDDENWNKTNAMIQPFVATIFSAFLFGILTNSVWFICFLVGAGLSFLVYVFTHQSRPPSGKILGGIWAMAAFYMCVMWIYTLAGELVAILSALGKILHLPAAFLGLTVLAWGNSIGDFFTNTAVAKQGLGEMALAGCYAGPVFNILMGFGVSLVYSSSSIYPKYFPVHFDKSAVVSIVFLYISLISTLVFVTLKDYRMDRVFGVYLISVYTMYSVCQALLLVM